jgi:hypothetical protein
MRDVLIALSTGLRLDQFLGTQLLSDRMLPAGIDERVRHELMGIRLTVRDADKMVASLSRLRNCRA